MAQIIFLIIGSGALNLAYFICGLYDSRISALARKKHNNGGMFIDMARMAFLVGLQMILYFAAGLASYSVSARLTTHAISIFFLYLGTKMSVIGLTGGIACGKSTVVELFDKIGQVEFKIIDSDKIVHSLYDKP